jgi:TRAP-type C4-dicarboxylate transport system substrate-binding protein
VSVFTALGFYDTAKYINETGNGYIFTYAAMSKRWFATLPADLEAMVLATATETTTAVTPWIVDFQARQRKVWVDKGGELDTLSAAEKTEMMAKLSSVGDDTIKTKPELQPLWTVVRAAVNRDQ